MSKNIPQKRKHGNSLHENKNIDTSKPSAFFTPQAGKKGTISVALPGSIIANAHTHDLKTSLAGQLARAFAVFCVHEVIIFHDGQSAVHRAQHQQQRPRDARSRQLAAEDEGNGYTAFADPENFLYHVLAYLETPPYLRKALFSHHPNLRTAGSLPSLDMPHHLRADEWCRYREAVTVAVEAAAPGSEAQERTTTPADNEKLRKTKRPKGTANGRSQPSSTSATTAPCTTTNVANAGLAELVSIDVALPANTRVTLDFGPSERPRPLSSSAAEGGQTGNNSMAATAVGAEVAREAGGYYWGYTTRVASSLSAVFTESPFADGYDYSIGTSERGQPLDRLLETVRQRQQQQQHDVAGGESSSWRVPKWNHLLLVFGGVAGLEKALHNDAELTAKGVRRPSDLFDAYVNLIHKQGSRTIRTEEAVWMGLMGLRELILAND